MILIMAPLKHTKIKVFITATSDLTAVTKLHVCCIMPGTEKATTLNF